MSARSVCNRVAKKVGATGRQDTNRPTLSELQRQSERQQREIDKLREQIAERDKQIAERDKRIAERDKQIADREKQIGDLERQLALRQQNSTNSSKPPSSDGLAGAPRLRGRRDKKKKRRKVGGQPGHRGAHRPLVPAERVDQFRAVLPQQCGHCGKQLPQQLGQVETTGKAQRHQVTELPPIQPSIIEYQCHKVVCPKCGESTRAPLPEEAKGQFGPQLTALIAYMTVVCRMPRRVVETLLAQVMGIEISLGSTQKCWEEASLAVLTPCQELEQQLKDQPVLNVDETGWRTNGDKRYLWAFVAARFVVYTVAASRGSEVLNRLLGSVFLGILCSDRFSAYLKYHKGKAQFCWAHLKRNLLGVLEFTKSTAVERFCRDALAQHAKLFRLWHKFRAGSIDRQQLLLRSIPIQQRLFALAQRHLESDHDQVRNLATAIFVYCERLFAFIEHEGVEPTNNSAERALRTGVQWRKVSFGNRSPQGELATARLLTVAETCHLQRLNVLIYIANAIRSHRAGRLVPSLFSRPPT
jgi:transposase